MVQQTCLAAHLGRRCKESFDCRALLILLRNSDTCQPDILLAR